MKILILGSTGRTGNILAQEALLKGWEAKVIVRNKDKINIKGLECYEGLPTDVTLIKQAIKDVDAAICCLNISRKSEFPWAELIAPKTLISDSMKSLIQVMGEENIKRVITMSAWGAGETFNQMAWIFRLLIKHSNIGLGFDDHNRQEDLLKKSSLDYTIVRPVFLNNKENNISYNVAVGKPEGRWISRKAVATFILDIVEKNLFIRESPVIYQK